MKDCCVGTHLRTLEPSRRIAFRPVIHEHLRSSILREACWTCPRYLAAQTLVRVQTRNRLI